MFVEGKTIRQALGQLYGTAGHLLKIWFVLKKMGFREGADPVQIDTSNSTDALKALFGCGAPDGRFFVPFAHTPRYLTMKQDASRSIIQTTIQRWASSGSVVTCDPTDYIDISNTEESGLLVHPARKYPFGLGINESGFALEDGHRVALPILAFAVWYGRWLNLSSPGQAQDELIQHMIDDLHITTAERELVFENRALDITLSDVPLDDAALFEICETFLQKGIDPEVEVRTEDYNDYTRRVTSMVTGLEQPDWLRISPEGNLNQLLKQESRAILLYGPPRTGKTRFIDQHIPRNSEDRETIQIHDGWGYDNLVEGLKPDDEGNWNWEDGPLKSAIESGKKYIVLEEINRTQFAQALGEVFSLIEDAYRGEEHGIRLRSGKTFFIPSDVTFFMTMNTVDKSTEEVDDALMGRVAAVECPPRSEDLRDMLRENGISADLIEKIAQVFSAILEIYPLGHGYFAGLRGGASQTDALFFYKSRVRPVLFNFLGELKQDELANIDNIVDQLLSK